MAMDMHKTSPITKLKRDVGNNVASVLSAMRLNPQILDGRSDHTCQQCGKPKLHINKPDGHGYCNGCKVEFGDFIELVKHQCGFATSWDAAQEIARRQFFEFDTSNRGTGSGSSRTHATPTPVANTVDAPKPEYAKAEDGYCLHGGTVEFKPIPSKCVPQFISRKPPLKRECFDLAGIKAVNRRSNNEFAVPIYGHIDLTVCNWACFPATGSKHTLKSSDGTIKHQSSMVAYSSFTEERGGVSVTHPYDRNGYFLTEADRQIVLRGEPVENLIAVKVEGCSDFLAICTEVNSDPNTTYLCFSNSDGCRSVNEADWFCSYLSKLEPSEVWIVHDCDIDGQNGANKWAKKLSTVAPVKNLSLPYSIEDRHGKDLRDYLNDGHGFSDLIAIASETEYFDSTRETIDLKADLSPPPQTTEQPTPTSKSSMPVKLIGITELGRTFTELREELIEGLLRRSEVCNVIASPKVGKSNLTGGLALSVATGARWLGLETKQGRVLMVDNELHLETIAYRLNRIQTAMGIDGPELDGQVDILSLRGHLCDIDGLGVLLGNVGKDYYSLIILDALYRFLPEGSSENDNAQMTALYNKLDSYAAMTGASIICVHHATKGDQSTKGITDMGSGAGSISRAADSHIAIRPHEQDGLCVLECVTRSFAQPAPISIRMEYPLWVATNAPAVLRRRTPDQSMRDQETDKKVLETMATLPKAWWSATQIRHKLSCGLDRVTRSLSRLRIAEAIVSEFQERKNKTVEVFRIEKAEITETSEGPK
jgi:hypothetical protein